MVRTWEVWELDVGEYDSSSISLCSRDPAEYNCQTVRSKYELASNVRARWLMMMYAREDS